MRIARPAPMIADRPYAEAAVREGGLCAVVAGDFNPPEDFDPANV
jgi:hypothetical protein